MTETEFLAQYDITKFDRPSLTTDIVLFSLNRDQHDIRKPEAVGIQVLLIKRESHPYQNQWALPGGFCKPNETCDETVARELFEETGTTAELTPINIYSKQDRDPRGWIISMAYSGFVDARNVKLRADTDAWDAKWFTIKRHEVLNVSKTLKKHSFILTHPDEKNLTFSVYERCNHNTKEYSAAGSDLAFDHAEILCQTYLKIQKDLTYDLRPIFHFFDDTFTLREVQTAYELFTGNRELNFHRKVKNFVIETNEKIARGYRPATLYRVDPNIF